MLSGYTMDGSKNILKWMKDTENNKIDWTDDLEEEYRIRLLNMTIYSWFNLYSFIRHVATTDYVPKLKYDWEILHYACDNLRKMLKADFNKYTYMEKLEEIFKVRNFSDCEKVDPWITFDDYIIYGCDELDWNYDELLDCKTKYKFDGGGKRVWQDQI